MREGLMSPEEAAERMRKMATGDLEADHYNADVLLCYLLRELGYGKVVDEFLILDKWYA